MRRFAGKSCVITGAAKGIGAATVNRIAAEGGRVVGLDLKNSVANASDLRDRAGISLIACDVRRRKEVEEALQLVVDQWGTIDVLINNAGVMLSKDFHCITSEELHDVWSVNVVGTFNCSQVAAKYMTRNGGGSIVNVASLGAFMTGGARVGYATTKGAVVSMTKAMAVALAPKGIRVNAVAPGSVATDMANEVHRANSGGTSIRDRTPLGRLGDPAEVAGAVSYLASQDASYTTGHCLVVDGGRSVLNYTMRE